MLIKDILEITSQLLGLNNKKKTKDIDEEKKEIKKKRHNKFFFGVILFLAIEITGILILSSTPLYNVTVGLIRWIQGGLENTIRFFFEGEAEAALLFCIQEIFDVLAAFTAPLNIVMVLGGYITIIINRSAKIERESNFEGEASKASRIKVKEYKYSCDEERNKAIAIDFVLWMIAWWVGWRVFRMFNLIKPDQVINVNYLEMTKEDYFKLIKEQISLNLLVGAVAFVVCLWFFAGWHIKIISLVESNVTLFDVTPFDYDNIICQEEIEEIPEEIVAIQENSTKNAMVPVSSKPVNLQKGHYKKRRKRR